MVKYFITSLIILLQIQTVKIVFGQDSSAVNRAEELLTSVKNCLNNNKLDSAYFNSNELINFSIKNNIEEYEGQGYKAMGNCFFLKENYDSAIYYYKKAVHVFNEIDYIELQGQTFTRIAIVYREEGNNDNAITYYNKGLEIFSIESNPRWYTYIKNHLGLLYMEKGDYFNALENMQDAVIAFQQTDNEIGLGREYNNMGIVYLEIKDNEKAEEAYLNAIEVLSHVEVTDYIGMAFVNLATIYLNKGEFKLALETMNNGKRIFEQTGYLVGLSGYYSVLSAYYNDKYPPDYYKVIESSNKGLSIAKKYNDSRQYAHATNVLGKAYMDINKIDDAEAILMLGLEVSEKNELNSISAIITKLLSEVYEKKQQPKLALKYLKKYITYNDSIINEEKIKEFTSLDLKFKFKQQQINDSLKQSQITQQISLLHEREINNQKQSELLLIFFIIIGVVITILLYYNYRKSIKHSKLLSLKNDQIKESLREKEVLLKEVHHRVKNNFQTVSSLLELQSINITDKNAIKCLGESQNRIKAMALIHQKLYQNDDISKVNIQEYIEQLVSQITSLYSSYNTKISIQVNYIEVDIDTAIPLGLIINELITNAFNYAFSEGKENILTISLADYSNSNYLLKISDNGSGLPKDIDTTKTNSLGLYLVKLLSKQLHGKYVYKYEDGSVFEIIFKDEEHRREIE